MKIFFKRRGYYFQNPVLTPYNSDTKMKNGFGAVILLLSLMACNDSSRTVSVKTDSIGRELDTLGNKIEKKAEQVSDSVKAEFNDIKTAVSNRIDSVKRARRDTIR